jgi:hypothetical protein
MYYIEISVFSGDKLSDDFLKNFANGNKCLHVDLPESGYQSTDPGSLYDAEDDAFGAASRYQMKEGDTMLVRMRHADRYDFFVETGASAAYDVRRRIYRALDDMKIFSNMRIKEKFGVFPWQSYSVEIAVFSVDEDGKVSPSNGFTEKFCADDMSPYVRDFDDGRADLQHAAVLGAIADVRGYEMKANEIVILKDGVSPFMVGRGEHGFEELLDRVEEFEKLAASMSDWSYYLRGMVGFRR